MAEARVALATPLGVPGSGRVRYGAAMALWRAGAMTLGELEAYRICASLDSEDPSRVAASAGDGRWADRAPAIRSAGEGKREGAILAAIWGIDAYLATLPGPGVAEVRAGIAAFGSGAVAAAVSTRPAPEDLLSPALRALDATHADLAGAIAAVAPHLDWITYDGYPPDRIGPSFGTGHAYANLIDPGGPIAAPDFCLGLFLIAPHVLYRDHHHAAPELYAPLTGPHGWRFHPGGPLTIKPAHQPVWNDPNRPHATKVGAVPFLAIFGWTRDVMEVAEVIDAPDWPALEALRL
jgi:hypothetical protein